jgi:hypothetical protein
VALRNCRKQEKAAKRLKAVTAIDAEIAAVKAGKIDRKPDEHSPAVLAVYRRLFIERIRFGSEDAAKNYSTELYLKSLSNMEIAAR